MLPKLKRALILEFSTVRALLTSLCTITVVGLVSGGLNPKVFGLIILFAAVLISAFIYARQRRVRLTQKLFGALASKDGLEKARLWLRKGADPNALNPYFHFQSGFDTPLISACQRGQTDIVELLIEGGAQVNVPIYCMTTPLITTAGNGQIELMRYLISNGADPNGANKDNMRPLDAAVEHCHEEAAELLRQHGGKHSDAYLRFCEMPRISPAEFEENMEHLIQALEDFISFLRGTREPEAAHWAKEIERRMNLLTKRDNLEDSLLLLSQVFGGMGSLNEFGFVASKKRGGSSEEEAENLNRRLNEYMSRMYTYLMTIDVPSECYELLGEGPECGTREGISMRKLRPFGALKRWRLPDRAEE